MKTTAHVVLVLFVMGATACKKEKKEEPPLDDPCALFCQRVPGCCSDAGLEDCEGVLELCLTDCEAMRTDNVDSGIDFDSIAECVNETALCYPLLGMDEDGFERTYSRCLSLESDCPHVGTCATEDEQHCCEDTFATCRYGEWVIVPCQSVCLETLEDYYDACDDSSGTEECYCGAAPVPCERYCNKGFDYCEERDWQGCADEGIESCSLLVPDCMAECAGLRTDIEACSIDADAVVTCMWHYARPLQILGCDPTGLGRVYSKCLGEVAACPETGSCSSDDEGTTSCCTGALSTCTGGRWIVKTCEAVCRDTTPETPHWNGVCEAVATVDTCQCQA